MPKSFRNEIYLTRPLLPDLNKVNKKLKEIWDSKWLSNFGEQHRILEDKIKAILNVPNTCLFNNGTIALITAIKSLALAGEVITTPFTFPATIHALSWNNLTPVFCDIDEQTLNIDAKRIEDLITPRTTAILAVHIFGTPCDGKALQDIADRYELKVIYDAAHAFGAEIEGKSIGIFGDISMFSFHATKIFHSVEGGCLTFTNNLLKARIELMRNFGIKDEDNVLLPGINGKMNEIQAAIGLLVMEMLDEERERRKLLKEVYYQELEGINGLSFPPVPDNVKQSYQYLTIRINEEYFGVSRDFVYSEFKKYNVFTRKYFYPLCSEYPFYKSFPSSKIENLKSAHRAANEVLCLPFYGGIGVDDVRKICEILRSFK